MVCLNSDHELKIICETYPKPNVATHWYQAPEMLLNCSGHTPAVDIWSLGCLLGEIMNREPLFPGTDIDHQFILITQVFLIKQSKHTYHLTEYVFNTIFAAILYLEKNILCVYSSLLVYLHHLRNMTIFCQITLEIMLVSTNPGGISMMCS